MTNADSLQTLPEVQSAVVGSTNGALIEAHREADGETVAAVAGFTASKLSAVGEQLGLGTLRRFSSTSKGTSYLTVVEGEALVSARLDPGMPSAKVAERLGELLESADGGSR